MSNPYMDRVCARMAADNAVGQLHAHWSARGEMFVHRIGYHLERAGFERLSAFYVDATDPLVQWFAERQRTFLRRWL